MQDRLNKVVDRFIRTNVPWPLIALPLALAATWMIGPYFPYLPLFR
jgi:hypothetical protein